MTNPKRSTKEDLSAIKIENLHIHCKVGEDRYRPIVENVALEFQEGMFHFLIGPNGCGKSTSVKAVMHLLDRSNYRIRSQMNIFNEAIWNKNESCMPPQEMREFLLRNVGYIPQDPSGALDRTLRVEESFRDKEKNLSKLGITVKQTAEHILTGLGWSSEDWENCKDRFPDELSGGQQQLVNIALSLYGDPKIIIVDEGFDYLDIFKVENALKFLVQKVIDDRLTIIAICHDYQLIYRAQHLLKNGDRKAASMVVHSLRLGHEDTMKNCFCKTIERLRKKLATPPETSMNQAENIVVHKSSFKYDSSSYIRNNSFKIKWKDFILPKGATIGIIGESGSGKTTLARILSGIIKTKKGIRVNGFPDRRTSLQYAYQIPNPCFNLAKAPGHMLLEGRNGLDQEQLNDLFKTLNWNNWEERNLYDKSADNRISLSGGELQKICLCRAVSWVPEILILDEPFNNLDPESHDGLVDILSLMNGNTKLLILHDIYLALSLCHYIILIKDGLIKFAGHSGPLINFLSDREPVNFPREMQDYIECVAENLDLIDECDS
jgi:peptide/nickel transport system ATP-binding protein